MGIIKKITVPEILQSKSARKLTALTAYDYTFARIFDQAGVDILLVGDSLGCVIQGHENTLSVTLDEMIYHTRCVVKGAERSLVVADLPFMSYQVSPEDALRAAGRVIKESGAAAVKLEGGETMKETIKRLVSVDIPVMGHVGLTPQSFHRMGGHKIQGKVSEGNAKIPGSREQILRDALAVAEAGAFALVLEGIPQELAAEITTLVPIPTIGIAVGDVSLCDGQILVSQDLLGLTESVPKFVKETLGLRTVIQEQLRKLIDNNSEIASIKKYETTGYLS